MDLFNSGKPNTIPSPLALLGLKELRNNGTHKIKFLKFNRSNVGPRGQCFLIDDTTY